MTVEFVTVPQAQLHGVQPFPACVVPSAPSPPESPSDFLDWAKANAAVIDAWVSCYGAVLFRGFSLSPTDFHGFVRATGWPQFDYASAGGNAVRSTIANTDKRVVTANEAPPDRVIPFHHELAQTPTSPRRLLFYCETPPSTGGETPILSSTRLLAALRASYPDFVSRLEKAGVTYTRVSTPECRADSAIGRGWRAAWGRTRAEAEAALRAAGHTWEWWRRDSAGECAEEGDEEALLRETSAALAAIRDGAFFNQVIAAYVGWRDEFNEVGEAVRFGDGLAFEKAVMEKVIEEASRQAVAVPWEEGDVLVLDNGSVQHSRASFTGPRRVLASLTK